MGGEGVFYCLAGAQDRQIGSSAVRLAWCREHTAEFRPVNWSTLTATMEKWHWLGENDLKSHKVRGLPIRFWASFSYWKQNCNISYPRQKAMHGSEEQVLRGLVERGTCSTKCRLLSLPFEVLFSHISTFCSFIDRMLEYWKLNPLFLCGITCTVSQELEKNPSYILQWHYPKNQAFHKLTNW